jgi:hypothetical protein
MRKVIIRWDEGSPDESAAAYRAFDAETDEFLGGGDDRMDQTLMTWETFGGYRVAAVESFRNDADRQLWVERLAVRMIGKFIADPHRGGDVYTMARKLLAQLAEAGVTLSLGEPERQARVVVRRHGIDADEVVGVALSESGADEIERQYLVANPGTDPRDEYEGLYVDVHDIVDA